MAWAEEPASTNRSSLTIDRIFVAGDFDAAGAPRTVWKQRGPGYYTLEEPRAGGGGRDLVWHDVASETTEVVLPAHAFIPPQGSGPLSIEDYAFSPDESKLLLFTRSRRVWRENTRGDYWLMDVTSRELRQLGGDAPPSSLMFAKFSPDSTRIAYVRGNDLHVEDARDGRITALTRGGSPTRIHGTFDWVYEEEFGLRDGFRWSPDGRSIAFWQLDATGVREFQLMDNLAGLYSQTVAIPYPKTGEANSAARIGIVPAQGGETRWLKIDGDPREHYLASLDWASNSTEVIVQQFNRRQNRNRVLLADTRGEAVRTVLTETDDAWLEKDNETRWVRGGEAFLWLSERDGWRHLYLVSRDGETIRRLTRGDFDVMDIVAVDEGRNRVYFAASPDQATQRYLYAVGLEGGAVQRITPGDQPGTHRYAVSPDGGWAFHTWSSFNEPPRTELLRLPEHTCVRVLEDNAKLRARLAELPPTSTEFFRVDIGEGVALDGWQIRPPDFDPQAKYPVLFHVYGETAGQTVLDAWGGRGRLWHTMLAQQGYVVMSLDNRGTPAPRGRAWRKIVHGQIGILASADQAAGLQAIARRWPWVDTGRIGIWGWSGGGSMTLNALFRYPDLYHVGMSVAPVPNQRLYDTIYQERYMGLPQDNPDGYRRGSPLNYAHQLKGHLLLVHGTGDDNVHYQGLEALIHELITYNKPFTMMAYPNRRHGISEGHNTRRHLYELLTRFLREKLPPGGLPSPTPTPTP